LTHRIWVEFGMDWKAIDIKVLKPGVADRLVERTFGE